MLEFLFKQHGSPIGLDIGHTMIKMIQLSQRDENRRVEAAEQARVDSQLEVGSDLWREAVTEAVGQMLHRSRFAGRKVVSCLPGDVVKIKSLRVDSLEPSEIDALIAAEVAPRLGLNPHTDEFRYTVAGSVFQGEQMKNEVIFLGISREQLAAHIAMLERVGLEPVGIETIPGALFRSFQATLRRQEDKELVSVFVDLGTKYTTVIIGRGQSVVFVKQIPLAGQQFNEQVAGRLGISLEEATDLRGRLLEGGPSIDADTVRVVRDAMSDSVEELAHEISLCFKYYAVTFRGQRPDEAVFAGGEAYEPALMEALKRHLGMPIRIAEPLRGFDLSRADFDRRCHPELCEWTIAVGLALRGFEQVGLLTERPPLIGNEL